MMGGCDLRDSTLQSYEERGRALLRARLRHTSSLSRSRQCHTQSNYRFGAVVCKSRRVEIPCVADRARNWTFWTYARLDPIHSGPLCHPEPIEGASKALIDPAWVILNYAA